MEGSEATITYTVENLPPGATFDAETATFTWTPDFNSANNYDVTFTATDDGDGTGFNATTTVTVPITVYNTNRAPEIIDFDNPSVNKGESTEFVIAATDAENDDLRFSLVREREAGFGIPEFINFVDNGDGTAKLTVSPTNKDASGSYSFTLVVEEIRSDSEAPLYVEKTFNINVEGTNDAPQINYIGSKVAVIGEALKFDLQVKDNNQDNLTFDIQGLPEGVTITEGKYGQASVEWTPTTDNVDITYPVTVKVTDSGNGNSDETFSDEQTFNIVVRNSNTAPQLNPIPNLSPEGTLKIKEAETLELQLQATDTDGDTITYFATNLPENASLNPETGLLKWTPNYTQAGIYDDITIIATDGNKQSTQTFSLEVENTNRSPVIIPLPTQVGDENSFLRFKVNAVDYDVEGVIYSVTSDLPEGATFDIRTGDFIWKPTYAQSGQYKITFEASDASGEIGKRDVNILITDNNRNPELKVSNRGVALGETLSFNLDGSDLDSNTQLTYSADVLPEGATLDAETGEFNWTPNPGQVDDYSINFSVSDGITTVTENALIKVALTPENPTVNLDLTPSFPVTPNQSVTITALADSFADIESINATVNGESVTIDEFGRFEFTPTTPGKVVVEAVATDADGRIGETSTVIKVRNPLDNDAPAVELAPDINANQINKLTDIVGEVDDINLDNWKLEIAEFGETKFTEIANGDNTVNDEILAQIDPNKLNNGFYQLRLTATDISGRTSTTETVVEINSTAKTSAYNRSETDLTYTFSDDSQSVTVDLVRTYNSLSKETATFGNGWKFANTDTDIQTNVPLTGREDLGVYEPFRVGTRLYLTTPTGERVGFTFAPQKQEVTGLTYYSPEWVADAGVEYKLDSAIAKLTLAGNRLYELNTGFAYNPASGDFDGADFTLTAADGTQYLISSEKGITEQIADGISLVYSDSGITSSTGETVQFVNNEQGFLKQIIAPDGTQVIYDYQDDNLIAARNLSVGDVKRYGYSTTEEDNSLTLVIGNPGTNGETIIYGETPATAPIISDLGGVVGWNGFTVNGNLTEGIDRYTVLLRKGEIESTEEGIVLVGVETQGSTSINGLTPLVTSSGYGLYAIDKAGLSLLEVAGSGEYDLKLNIAGDINNDGAVDGVDSELLSQVIVSNADYDSIYDFNRDGVVNANDMQILGSNYGFAANRAPIVTASEVLTHTDLETFIELDTLATDPEGDRIYFRLANPEQGSISFTPDGKFARFTPNAGYSGDASFELIADDGYSTATPVTVDINVSDAPLVNLDIVNRSPRLDAGESTQLVAIGDFTDQEDVILPASYLQFANDNELVARVTDTGVLVGEGDGVSIVSVQKNGIEAVTAVRVGDLLPTNSSENNILLAENNGLNVYPGAVILTEDATRQMLVGIKAIYESPDLKDASTGTRYFVNNPDIVDVSTDGLITALNNGIANITVIHGASEYILPVIVESPTTVSTTNGTAAVAQLDDEGGIVEIQVTDSNNEELTTQLMVAPGTLFDDTDIRFTPLLEESQVSLATPEDFRFISGFKLEAGEDPLAFPLQLAMELPSQYKNDPSVIGQTVYFFEKGYVPDATGEIEEQWLVAETGIVDADGMIRTQSPPWKGVREGEYMTSFDRVFGSGKLVKGKVVATFNMPAPFVSLFPFSYTQVNNFNTISIGNLDSDIEIRNNNTDAYISDGKLTTKVLDSSLRVEYEEISLEIGGVGKDIFDIGNKILGLNKEETSLTEDIEKLRRIYEKVQDVFGEGEEDKKKDAEVKRKTLLDKITSKEEELAGVKSEIEIKRDNKKALELRKSKLTKRKNTLLDTFNSFTSLPGTDLLGMLETAPFLSISYDISSLKVTQVPAIGLPQVTQTGVQLDADGLPTFEVKLDVPEVQETGPAAPPVLQQAQLRFQDENNQSYENNQPVLFLTGSNVLVENGDDELGRKFEDLIVKFQMGLTTVEVPVLTELSERLPDNEFKVAVKVPNGIVLGMTDISLIRRQNKVVRRIGPVPIKEEVKFESNKVELEATGEYILGVQRLSDFVSVIDGRDPNTLPNISSSADLLLARIPIGDRDVRDRPRDIAVTSDGSRAYATLENTGKLALIDTMVLQQIDINPQTEDVIDPIDLGTDASPSSIVIDSRDRYAYISDSRIGVIYVVDVDATSGKYHQVVEKIQVEPAPKGLREMAISSDGRRLFVAAPSTRSTRGLDIDEKSQIIVINIDPKDRPLNESRNEKKWHKQIAQVEAGRRVEGMSTTPDPKKIVFTNRQDDDNGYGILEIIEDEPDNFVADTRYASLRLGPKDDYFDLNNGVSVTVTRDGQYGFVVGNNSGPFLALGSKTEDVDGVQAGSNVGIIEDPLGENPQLIGATRPLPVAFSSDLVLSPDDKYLYVANPNGVGVTTYDVDEIIYTLNNPGDFTIDLLDRSEGSKFYDENTARQAKFLDFFTVPIDDINPLVSVTADYGIIAEDRPRGQFTYGVLEVPDGNGGFVESSNGPIGTFVHNLQRTDNNWLRLRQDLVRKDDLTPTLVWDLKDRSGEEVPVREINLFLSVFPEEEGLVPWDNIVDLSGNNGNEFLHEQGLSREEQYELLTKEWNVSDYSNERDFNPNRIITATWKDDPEIIGGTWYWGNGEVIGTTAYTPTTFTFGDERTLTAGQKYHWAVEAYNSMGERNFKKSSFKLDPAPPLVEDEAFRSVSVLTHGFKAPIVTPPGIPDTFYNLAGGIADSGNGLIMKYDRTTGFWVPVDKYGQRPQSFLGPQPTDPDYKTRLTNYVSQFLNNDKPLVLLSDWSDESNIPDSGFSEAAADSLFASLVQLDQWFGGEVGDEQGRIYDEQGKLIRTQGAIFNSPLHFIGFSRGTVVNSEIVQRVGTYFPDAGGTDETNRDLQMTTLDPHDFNQPSLQLSFPIPGLPNLDYSTFYEPKVQVWDNVTFADNYYQTVPELTGNTFTPAGRDIPRLLNTDTYGDNWPREGWRSVNPNPDASLLGETDLSILLGTNNEQQAVYGLSSAGFTKETDPIRLIGPVNFIDGLGATHGRVLTWYSGTSDLSLREAPDELYRRLGDAHYEYLFDREFYNLERDPRFNPWYKPDHEAADLVSNIPEPNEGIGTGWFYSALGGGKDLRPETNEDRISLDYDNTDSARMRGDFAVPTLFNGNFDAVTNPDGFVRNRLSREIPGWSFHGGTSNIGQPNSALVDWRDIDSLRVPGIIGYDSENAPISDNQSYLENLRIEPENPNYETNYALKLEAGQSIVHNRFVVPEWGALQFNLHVPNIAELPLGTEGDFPHLRVFMSDAESGTQYQLSARNVVKPSNINSPREAQRLFGVELNYGDSPFRVNYQGNQVGYGNAGFERFNLDIPDQLRGKSVTLRFDLDTNIQPLDELYLDDIFFKNQHLLLGNPTVARNQFNPNLTEQQNDAMNSTHENNYLIEKPQYAIAYNRNDNTPLWVSWQLNETWLGSLVRESFEGELTLPSDWYRVRKDDYNEEDGDIYIDGKSDWREPGEPYQLAPGHMVPAADRRKNRKDAYSVASTINVIPQHELNNSPVWERLENFSRNLVTNKNKELYIITGGYGTKPEKQTIITQDLENEINVPEFVWKIIVVLDRPGQGIADITADTPIITVVSENDFRTNLDGTPLRSSDGSYLKWYEGGMDIISVRELENRLNNDTTNQQRGIHYDFFSNIPQEIQNIVEDRRFTWIGNDPIDAFTTLSSPLLTDNNFTPSSKTFNSAVIIPNTSIWHNGVAEKNLFKVDSFQVGSSQVSVTQIGTPQVNTYQDSSGKISSSQISFSKAGVFEFSPFQVGSGQIGKSELGEIQVSFFKNGIGKVGTNKTSFSQRDLSQISPSQISPIQKGVHSGTSEVSTTQINFIQIQASEVESSKISSPITVLFNQFLSVHTSTSELTNTFKDNLPHITLEITDLPTGQLAEAQVTEFTDQGIPNGGKILIDHNANGLGWFIDTTPLDHSEFSQTLTDTALLATADSEAHGKYDLLTTILHELGHLAGFISGYNEFDRHIQTINGKKTFVADNFTATLSPDGSHLDSEAHPHDLMNTTLRPGVRKLPSLLNLQILSTLRGSEGVREGVSEGILTAPLTSTPLFGINNGTFDTQETWSTRGAANIIEGQAVLTEESRLNSSFTQDFIIPEEAKYLQFTILDADLDSSNLAPGDAFEVALLDTNTFTPLAGFTSEFSQTDALLNIQHDGDTYFSDKVKLSGAPTSGSSINLNSPRTVTIDIRDIAPNTEATLYFDLLGFGSKQSKVIIDNVRILTDDVIIPVANNNTATTNQGQPVIIDILDNDSDADGTINPSTVQIETAPTNGNITINDDNTITYTPNSNQPGEDSFTYTVQDDEGNTSNTATVNITINNTAPSINEITVEPTISEGIAATFSATATDLDELTYTWDFGDNTEPVTGQNVSHTFADNGTYTATLTVTDSNGAPTVETITLTVNNVAPTVNAGDDQTAIENQEITFNGNYTDPGILDTHTIEWDLGDGTVVENQLNPTHTYTTPGSYIATLTVTDSDGGTDSDTLEIQVNNAAPEITEITGDTNTTEGAIANFNAAATSYGGNDLTYTWDFRDGSDTAEGETVNHQFADNGTYIVTLTVANDTGETTQETLTVNVDNVAPVVEAGDNQITLEGTTVNFNGNFSDPGILDTHTIEWDFGDGNTTTGILEPTYTYSQQGTYTVTLTITDSDGAATQDILTVTVNNVAPIITEINGDTNINEGDTANFSATATDPGNDTLTYTWDFGDGSQPAIGENVNHQFTDNGTYNVTLNVEDADGGITTETLAVEVSNVAPVITEIVAGTDIKQGETASFSATVNDPGNDTLTYNWDFGDGSEVATGETVEHTFTEAGNYTVTLTVTDSDGASNQQTLFVSALPTAPLYAIRTEKQIRINNGGDLDGNPQDINDDALIYSAKGFTINGNITLPVQRDENGNPLRDSSGKLILVDKAVTVASNYTTINANTNQYSNLVPPQVVDEIVIDIPNHDELKQQTLDTVIAPSTQTVTFNSNQNSLNNSKDWDNKFPAPGTESNPTVVRVTGGGLNIPNKVNIANYVIVVENGDINFNGSKHNFDNVVLIAENGNINLSQVQATNLSVFASRSINMNNQARFAGSTLLASLSTNGSINFNGATTSTNSEDNLRVVSQGRITFNAASDSRGSFESGSDFTFNNNSTLYGSIAAKGFITFNNGANVIYTNIAGVNDGNNQPPTNPDDIQPPIINAGLANDTGTSSSDKITSDPTINGTLTDDSQIVLLKASFDDADVNNYFDITAQLQSNGSFTLDKLTLESIKGNTLPDDNYTLYLQAVDSKSNTSNVFEFAFTLDTTTPPTSNNSEFAIKTEGVLTINGGGDLDGELSNLDDDTLVYAAQGFKLNGNFELPVELNPNGTPQLDNSGKKILRDNAITVADGYTSSKGPSNEYAGLQPPQIGEGIAVNIPAYSDLKQQKLDSFVPDNSQTISFDISDNNNRIYNANTWNQKFPVPGTADNPTVVEVIGGELNIPNNVNLSNYVIIVQQGSIEFKGSNNNLDNVVLITNNGDINLAKAKSQDVSVFASGSVNMNGAATFARDTLIASGSSTGNVTFRGSFKNINASDTIRVVSNGDIIFNGASDTRGIFESAGKFTSNGKSTVYGKIAAKGDIRFNGGVRFVAE